MGLQTKEATGFMELPIPGAGAGGGEGWECRPGGGKCRTGWGLGVGDKGGPFGDGERKGTHL